MKQDMVSQLNIISILIFSISFGVNCAVIKNTELACVVPEEFKLGKDIVYCDEKTLDQPVDINFCKEVKSLLNDLDTCSISDIWKNAKLRSDLLKRVDDLEITGNICNTFALLKKDFEPILVKDGIGSQLISNTILCQLACQNVNRCALILKLYWIKHILYMTRQELAVKDKLPNIIPNTIKTGRSESLPTTQNKNVHTQEEKIESKNTLPDDTTPKEGKTNPIRVSLDQKISDTKKVTNSLGSSKINTDISQTAQGDAEKEKNSSPSVVSETNAQTDVKLDNQEKAITSDSGHKSPTVVDPKPNDVDKNDSGKKVTKSNEVSKEESDSTVKKPEQQTSVDLERKQSEPEKLSTDSKNEENEIKDDTLKTKSEAKNEENGDSATSKKVDEKNSNYDDQDNEVIDKDNTNGDIDLPQVPNTEIDNENKNTEVENPANEFDDDFAEQDDSSNPSLDILVKEKSDADKNTAPKDIKNQDTLTVFPEEDSHFFAYFLTVVVLCIAGYLLFHNKQKIFALIIEGRHERRRRPNGGSYKRLDNKDNIKGTSHVIF